MLAILWVKVLIGGAKLHAAQPQFLDTIINLIETVRRIRIDQDALGMSGNDFIWALKSGTPSIHPGERELAQGAVIIHPFGLQEGEELMIAARVKAIVAGERIGAD